MLSGDHQFERAWIDLSVTAGCMMHSLLVLRALDRLSSHGQHVNPVGSAERDLDKLWLSLPEAGRLHVCHTVWPFDREKAKTLSVSRRR